MSFLSLSAIARANWSFSTLRRTLLCHVFPSLILLSNPLIALRRLFTINTCLGSILTGANIPPVWMGVRRSRGSFSRPRGWTTAPVRDHGPRMASWMGLLTPHLILGSEHSIPQASPDSARWPGSRIGSLGWLRIQYEITDPALNPASDSGPARGLGSPTWNAT